MIITGGSYLLPAYFCLSSGQVVHTIKTQDSNVLAPKSTGPQIKFKLQVQVRVESNESTCCLELAEGPAPDRFK